MYRITDLVLDRFYLSPPLDVTVVEAPTCSSHCVARHPKSSHLAEKIRYVNDNLKRDGKGKPFGDVLLSVHMNSSGSEKASGVEVIYSHFAPHRRAKAERISKIVAATLGLPDRGPKTDRESQRGSLAILNRTDCPAYLLEIGFVTNPEDVLRVRECGVDALIAAIGQIQKDHQ